MFKKQKRLLERVRELENKIWFLDIEVETLKEMRKMDVLLLKPNECMAKHITKNKKCKHKYVVSPKYLSWAKIIFNSIQCEKCGKYKENK